MLKKKLSIDGMSCEHCARAVKEALESVAGVRSVTVDLASKIAEFETDRDDLSPLVAAVEEEGYEAKVA